MLGPPVALICSLIGLVRRQSRAAAVMGIGLSGLCLLLFFGLPLLSLLCR